MRRQPKHDLPLAFFNLSHMKTCRLNMSLELRNLPLRLRLEPAAENPEGTVVVEVPVDAGEGVRTARDLSVWEQLSFAAFLQRYWADNQASMFLSFLVPWLT